MLCCAVLSVRPCYKIHTARDIADMHNPQRQAVQMHGLKVMHDETMWLELSTAGDSSPEHYVFGDLIADASGQHTHTIVQASTPGVMHFAIFSQGAKQVCRIVFVHLLHVCCHAWVLPVRQRVGNCRPLRTTCAPLVKRVSRTHRSFAA